MLRQQKVGNITIGKKKNHKNKTKNQKDKMQPFKKEKTRQSSAITEAIRQKF